MVAFAAMFCSLVASRRHIAGGEQDDVALVCLQGRGARHVAQHGINEAVVLVGSAGIKCQTYAADLQTGEGEGNGEE